MEYKNTERARTKKIAHKAKKAWIIISSIIAGGIIFLIAVGILIDLSEPYLDNHITRSTIRRVGLPVDSEVMALINSGRLETYTDIKTDEYRRLMLDPLLWRRSVAGFYERTGVLVHLYSSERADYTKEEIKEIYIKAFDDPELSGANLLIIISYDYENWVTQNDFIMGLKAAEFMNMEATAILMDSMTKIWVFSSRDAWRCRYSNALDEAGKRMMTPTTNRAVPVGLTMLGVVVVVLAVVVIWKKKHKNDEEIYRILNTPLEELADKRDNFEETQT
jgi:hypothetical protein